MSDETPIRHRLRDLYIRFFEDGTPITLAQLSERSKILVGQHVPITSIRWWSATDHWSSRLRGQLEAIPNLSTTSEFLYHWKEAVLSSRYKLSGKDKSWKDRAADARGFLTFVKKIPQEMRWRIETDIFEVSDHLQKTTLANWDSIPSTYRNTLSTVWSELDGMLDVAVYVEEDGVEREKILMAGRE